jgi:DNA-binding GntR family transcriptional regulator
MAGGMVIKPISATEAVAASLRERIFDGAIEPGARLPELELAADFGVARPTVRAAIQTLCHEGLLQRERNRSAFVPELTIEDVLDLFSVRIPLECLIVREVLERKAPLGPVEEAITRLTELTPRSPWSRVVDADLGFHRALASATGSPRLEKLYLSLSGEIRLCIAQLRPAWPSPAAMAAEHRSLLDVIEAGDVDLAIARMTAHLERAVRDLTPAEDEVPAA